MKRILFTGGSGFIGQNVLPFLREKFIVFAPKRDELDLFDEQIVKDYILENKIDIVIHTANPTPKKNELDSKELLLKNSIRMFLSFYNNKEFVEKIIFIGSGASYGKQDDIVSVVEGDFLKRVPKDDYGLAKQIFAHLSRDNVYNLCLFGCYGPGDADFRFITHAIRCCMDNEPITIRQDCYFDYIHVYDLVKVMIWAIESSLEYNLYNVCSGKKYLLSNLAEEVKRQMKSSVAVEIQTQGLNKEYTASNQRLLGEYKGDFISIEDGIKMQIEWEKAHYVLGSRPKE